MEFVERLFNNVNDVAINKVLKLVLMHLEKKKLLKLAMH